jgi:hypothetical protein
MAVAAALSSWLGAGTPVSAATQTAHYTVTFVATWSAQTHPANFPSSAHFSGLIGGTHNGSVSFWAPGQLATPGIEKMAEEGDKLTLQGEVQAAINAATAGEVISGGGISPSPGSVTQSFTIDLAHPLVTVVSMVAPTPDWFVGVHGLTLFENGDWVNQKSVVLLPYDSGTDDGTTYLSANLEASPHQSIGLITTLPLGNGATLGTMTFTRTDSAVPMQSGGLLVLMAACLGIAGAMFVARDRDLRRSASLLP